MDKKKKKKVGRKLFDGKNIEIVLQKLEEVFSIGGSDTEACFYADISSSAFYEYQKKHPEFLERKRALLQKPNLRARQEVIKGLVGNPEFALKYLERKLPDEFSSKMRLEHSGEINTGKEEENKYDKWPEAKLREEFERRRQTIKTSNSPQG